MSGPIVVKVGGAALDEPGGALWPVVSASAMLGELVVVHGGGARVDARLGAHGWSSQRVGGIRLTPSDHMGVVAGALGGEVNAEIVDALQRAGASAVGLTIADGGALTCVNAGIAPGDRVGKVVGSDASRVQALYGTLLSVGIVPVVASIGSDADGLLNINADDAAEGLAAALGARALLLLSDVPGVLGKDGGVIPEIDPVDVDDLVADGTVSGGMEAKVRAAVRASDALDGPVVIASWREPGVIADAAAGRFGGIGTTVARVPLRSA